MGLHEWLQLAYDDRAVWMSYLAVDPVFDDFRSDQRFQVGISPATFRRRNSVAGGSFRRFREETLVEASLSLLADEARSVSSIAAELGYADARSYRRFIKGAPGSTPDQIRANSVAARMRALEPEVIARIERIATRLSR
jgi:AraC-like DNA-binding protein